MEPAYAEHLIDCLRLLVGCYGKRIQYRNRWDFAQQVTKFVGGDEFPKSVIWDVTCQFIPGHHFNPLRPKEFWFTGNFEAFLIPDLCLPEAVRRGIQTCIEKSVGGRKRILCSSLFHPIFREDLFRLSLPLVSPEGLSVASYNWVVDLANFNENTDNFCWLLAIAYWKSGTLDRLVRDIDNGQSNELFEWLAKYPLFAKACRSLIKNPTPAELSYTAALARTIVHNFEQFYQTFDFAYTDRCVGRLRVEDVQDLGCYFFEKEVELKWVTYLCKAVGLPILLAVRIGRDIISFNKSEV